MSKPTKSIPVDELPDFIKLALKADTMFNYTLLGGPYNGETMALPNGSTSTLTFTAKGRTGKYVILESERTNARDPDAEVTPTHTKLYWEAAE